MKRLLGLGAALVALLLGGIGVWRWQAPDAYRPHLGRDGLVTNELTERHADQPGVRRSADWQVTSGSLFAVDGAGYSGRPDDDRPDPESRISTDSAVFRMVTRRRDFTDVRIRFRLRVDQLVQTDRTPAAPYDGVHLFLRYRSSRELYAISLQRRDNTVIIKRKDPGGSSNGGTYTELASAAYPLTSNWIDVEAGIRDAEDHTTRIALRLDGRQLVSATDSSAARVIGSGGFGLRGDNAEFHFADITAEAI
ncbi:hypothetical protein [Actinoplanes sp. N902-109]|uniref:hypothetical protein n=1 Tax=Actinoplanes sp. (strain N902-109) TaxID=649831 RepID=UPI0003293643|nr:hypothetical protein [Actinoplanes sp. N902-109]AGL20825.1 hypothetical protein L083_7315 [Actinoplanes sp. N902-109]